MNMTYNDSLHYIEIFLKDLLPKALKEHKLAKKNNMILQDADAWADEVKDYIKKQDPLKGNYLG